MDLEQADMFAATDSDEEFSALQPLNLERTLGAWRNSRTRLGFSYFRSGGAVMQTGIARIRKVSSVGLVLDCGEARLAMGTQGATAELKSVAFFSRDFQTSVDVYGLSIFLSNHDWLFLYELTEGSPSPDGLEFGVTR